MQIATSHATSSFGMPVIVDDHGAVLDYADGIRRIRRFLELSTREFAKQCGVSQRTVEGWEQGRLPSAQALNAIDALDQGENQSFSYLDGRMIVVIAREPFSSNWKMTDLRVDEASRREIALLENEHIPDDWESARAVDAFFRALIG